MNRKQFFGMLQGMSAGELTQVQLAYWLAKNGHRLQKRDSGERYFEHPRDVAISLIERGFNDMTTIVLALLHDSIEDTNTPPHIYVNLFGHDAWEHLFLLSKNIPVFDPITGQIVGTFKKPSDQYYDGIRNGPRCVRLVKIADRRHNMKSMGSSWPEERRIRYAKETADYLVPIAQQTDPGFAGELSELVSSTLKK